MCFLESCREMQFIVCNFGRPCTCPCTEREGENFYTGEKKVRKAVVNSPWLFIVWVLARKEYESFLFFLGFAFVSKSNLTHPPDEPQNQSTDTRLWWRKVLGYFSLPWFLSCHSKELKWQTRIAWGGKVYRASSKLYTLKTWEQAKPCRSGPVQSLLSFLYPLFPPLSGTWGLIACALWKWGMSLRPNREAGVPVMFSQRKSSISSIVLLFFCFCFSFVHPLCVCVWSPSHHFLWLQFWTLFFLL